MKKALFILLSIALLCSIMTITVYADSEAIAEDTAATTAGEETSEAELQSVSTEPPISSGVYRFDSLYNTNMCMKVEEDGYFNGALVLQWNTSTNSRETLFKVEYAGYGTIPATNTTEYYYVIRSMVNSAMGLTGQTDGSVCLRPLVADNSSQAATQYWVYTEDSGCDVWMNTYTGEYLGTPTTASNGDELVLTTSTTRSWWQMVAYTGGVMEGVEFSTAPSTVNGGATVSYQAYMYSSRIGVNGPIHYSVTCDDGDATIHADVGALTAVGAGSVEVRAYVSGMSADATCTVNIIGYKNLADARKAFFANYYEVATHVQLQLVSRLYSTTSGGVTTYNYTFPTGDPHAFVAGASLPAGATAIDVLFIDVIHGNLSDDDKNACQGLYAGYDLYYYSGGTHVYLYINAASEGGSFEVGTLKSLDDDEIAEMEVAFLNVWIAHENHGCSTIVPPEWYSDYVN